MNGQTAMNLDSALRSEWRAGIYCRLSKDDELQGESASISNQRELLRGYCRGQGWEIVAVFEGDGYTGLNMDRPGLRKLLDAVKDRRINMVLTKDLSRLGRNYLETGQLMDMFFPKHGVRYIAINDGIDTDADSNDIAPFKNILNEMYSKDISKKVHSSYLLHAKQGKFTGCVAPIGYRKDPDVKGHLLIDEDTAWIVRRIFALALEGKGSNYIRRWLEFEQIPCPAWWNRQKGIRPTVFTKWERKDPENGRFMWDFSVIEDILVNPVYYGAIASQKVHYKFKVGVVREKKPEEWIVVEDQHEPIIDKRTFDIVQHKIRKRMHEVGDEVSLFSGLIKCGECGKTLTVRYTNAKNPVKIYACVTYNKFGKQHCTQHRIDYDFLYHLVLSKIREAAQAAIGGGDEIVQRMMDARTAEAASEKEMHKRNIQKAEARLAVIDKMIAKLYEDLIEEKIETATFDRLLQKAQSEQVSLNEHIRLAQEMLEDEARIDENAQAWVEEIRQYADITELDRETLHRLVKEIIVHEEIDADRHRNITVEIHFNFKAIPEISGTDIHVETS